MSDTDQKKKGAATMPCRVCGEDIKQGARKCIHCDSWQDWRAELSVSTSVLSLLVALVVVSSAAIPAVQKVFQADNSSLVFSFQSRPGTGYSVFASNLGTRPGVVEGGSIRVQNNHGWKSGRLTLIDGPEYQVVQPGATTLVHLKIVPVAARIECPTEMPTKCSMTMFARNYDGSPVEQLVGANCADIIHTGLYLFSGDKIGPKEIAQLCPEK